jgi:mono/diheme cytochrome c family protein
MTQQRRIRTGAATGVLVVAVALGAACSGEIVAPGPNAPAPPTNSNASAANTSPVPDVRPVALEGEALARTAKLFDATCATCHTTSGTGDPHHRKDKIPDFTDRSWQAGETDAELHDTIAKGTGKVMPAFGEKLSGDQIDELVAYVRGFPDRPAPAAEALGPMRHDEPATKPGSSKADAPRKPARKPAKPAPAKKAEHGDHGDHPHD